MTLYNDNKFKQSKTATITYKAGLYLISTPIGNLSDISERMLETIKQADILFCEDPLNSIKFLRHHGISRSLRKYNDHSGEKTRLEILHLITAGKKVGLMSDAGTPTIADPGYKLVNFLVKHNVYISPIVGPTALIAALSISGFATNEFFFAGFSPRKKNDKEKFLKNLLAKKHSIIFYEAASRVSSTLEVIAKLKPETNICVCRELTKRFEEVIRGEAKEVSEMEITLKGEFVIVLPGAAESENEDCERKIAMKELISILAKEIPPAKLATILGKLYGRSKQDIYKDIIQS